MNSKPKREYEYMVWFKTEIDGWLKGLMIKATTNAKAISKAQHLLGPDLGLSIYFGSMTMRKYDKLLWQKKDKGYLYLSSKEILENSRYVGKSIELLENIKKLKGLK